MKLPRLLHRKILYCSPVNQCLWAFCFSTSSVMWMMRCPLVCLRNLLMPLRFMMRPLMVFLRHSQSSAINPWNEIAWVRYNLTAKSELFDGQVVGEPIISGYTAISKGIPIWIESTQKCSFMRGQFDEMRILNLTRRNFYLEYENRWLAQL